MRKVEWQANINLSIVSSVCFCPSEAQEVLAAVTYLNEEGLEMDSDNDVKEKAEKEPFWAIHYQLHASAIVHQKEMGDPGRESYWSEQSEEWVYVDFVRERTTELDVTNNIVVVCIGR